MNEKLRCREEIWDNQTVKVQSATAPERTVPQASG